MSNKRFINPSGFPENLPAGQVIEDSLKATIQQIAESYGYSRLETASVEYLDTLASKGDIDKEIYTLGRALAEGDGTESDRGLHFDLTVPLARYVAQNQGELWFPYRRYQVQKVWRGERPQKGRFREFYQADIDVVGRENLPLAFDAEVALVMAHILSSFAIGSITMKINNRKFLQGVCSALGVEDVARALQIIDKLDKIGESEVKRLLIEEVGLADSASENLFTIIANPVPADQVEAFLTSLPMNNEQIDTGIYELQQVFSILTQSSLPESVAIVFDPSIARGLDYYTGTVYETTVDGFEQYGSICSGGRYADLASRFTNQTLPGVGMSIGLTRLLAIIQAEGLRSFSAQTRTDLTLCLLDEEQLIPSLQVAALLREKGLNVEMNYKPSVGLGKQLDQIKQKGIHRALVCERDGNFTLFNLLTGQKQLCANMTELLAALSD